MKYKESLVEAILTERELGKTYKEIAEKLKLSIKQVKRAVMFGEVPIVRKKKKVKD